jgi:hypothetical protein
MGARAVADGVENRADFLAARELELQPGAGHPICGVHDGKGLRAERVGTRWDMAARVTNVLGDQGTDTMRPQSEMVIRGTCRHSLYKELKP